MKCRSCRRWLARASNRSVGQHEQLVLRIEQAAPTYAIQTHEPKPDGRAAGQGRSAGRNRGRGRGGPRSVACGNCAAPARLADTGLGPIRRLLTHTKAQACRAGEVPPEGQHQDRSRSARLGRRTRWC